MIKKTVRDNSVKHAKSRKTKNRLAINEKKTEQGTEAKLKY